MNTLLNAMSDNSTLMTTANGATAYKTTKSALMDLFGLGASYRGRSEDDVIFLFQKAFEENPVYALKCLFYIRDCREGAGERRFFRVCMRWLADNHTDAMRRNIKNIPIFGRWDDLYTLDGTKCHNDAYEFMKRQLILDLKCETPSLLAKWLKSENTSSYESRELAGHTRKAFNMTAREYRKTLSLLRARINVLERLMSEGRWDEIEFDKIPSVAGFRYRNAFARHDLQREEKGKQSYTEFVKDETKTVNAGTLYPYQCVESATKLMSRGCHYDYNVGRWVTDEIDATERAAINKYWDNIPNVMEGATFNGLVICDTSGSMRSGCASVAPIDVAISLAMYCAERAAGPFADHYISFSSRPQLIKVEGIDFCDKVRRIYETNLCQNTNLEAAFDMVLNTAVACHIPQKDMPEALLVISDMQIDRATTHYDYRSYNYYNNEIPVNPVDMEAIKQKWADHGYQIPRMIYWNVNASKDTFLDNDPYTTFVSGFSQNIFKQLMYGVTGYELMMKVLDAERYECVK